MSRAASRKIWLGSLTLLLGAASLGSSSCLQSGYVLERRTESEVSGGTGGMPNAAVGGEAGQPALPASCDATFQSGTNFAVCRAEYWGSTGDDRWLAATSTPKGGFVRAGSSASLELGIPTLSVEGATSGVLVTSGPSGEPLSAARIGSEVTAVATLGSRIVAGSDLGISVFDANLRAVLAENHLGGVARLAASSTGVVALMSDGRVLLLDADAALVREVGLGDAQVEDVALSETGVTVVTGARQAVAGGACQGRFPVLRAFAADGLLAYANYDFDDAPGWCASSTGRRLSIGGGKLYYAGQQQGGNSVHTRDPHDLTLPAPLVSYDLHSNGSGKAIDVYSFVARFDLESGALEAGQVIVPRDGDVGGALSTSALAVDSAGRLFIAGRASCCIERRNERLVADQPLGAYQAPELSLLILSPDLRERLSWTTFTSATGAADADVTALALAGETGLLLANVATAPGLLTVPADLEPPGGPDGYQVLFPAP